MKDNTYELLDINTDGEGVLLYCVYGQEYKVELQHLPIDNATHLQSVLVQVVKDAIEQLKPVDPAPPIEVAIPADIKALVDVVFEVK